jgi:hypothetical protein
MILWILGDRMREHIGDIRSTVALQTAIVECCQKCQDCINGAFMAVMQGLECCSLLIELIVLLTNPVKDSGDDLLLLLKCSNFTS